VDSFTRDSLVRLKGSQVVASLERLEAFSNRVNALLRASHHAVGSPGVSVNQAAELLSRVELSVRQASEGLRRGRSHSGPQASRLLVLGPGEDVRKDSTRTSLIT